MLLRRTHWWPVVFGPAHREGTAIDPPAEIHTTLVRRERPVFAVVGGELVKREPDGLCGSRFQVEPGAVDDDARTNEVGEVRELGAHQVLDIDPVPFVADKQVLIRSWTCSS